MALRDEQADILGGPILRRPESGLFVALSQYHFVFKSVTLFGFCLLVWIACARGFEHLKKHRELRYRKAMRRKHGIPDSDCRPFAVAYAAAKRAHLEREAQDRKKLTNMSDHNFPDVDQRTNAQKDTRALRRRVPETTVQLHDYQHPEKYVAVFENKRPEVQSLDFVDRYNHNIRRRVAIPESLLVERPTVRRAGRRDLNTNFDDNEESRKRSFEDESDVKHEIVKKSRIEGDELIDGGEHADWYAQYSDALPRRAPKELDQQPEEDYVHLDGQERSRRVNDLRDEDHECIDEIMQGVDEDEVTELKAVVRGRKRDRAEAGSTFGGDDDEDVKNGKASHLRKRRTIFRRGVETSARGQKRDREAESPESEGEGGDSETARRRAQRSSKKKRGKKAASEEVSEVSMEDPRVSKDPLCGGRRVGDEWEDDGIHYKVGDKGQRLRLTLVKKARNKYHMPQDSQHPDRSAALEIYVETWMTEEQYKQAEGRRELAWQEVQRESNEYKIPDVLDSPTNNGKNLLWDSVKGSPALRPFRQFMLSNSSIRINPFEQWPAQPTLGRRVASSSTTISPILPGVTGSPTRPGFRGFSKWEKQDREAEAMARIRAKMEEQKKAQKLPKKSAEISTSVTAPELSIKPLSVPTITLTPAPTVAASEQSDSSRQSKSALSFATPPNTIPGLSLPSTSVPAATLLPGTSAVPPTTSSTASPFLSTKPPQVPFSTSTATPSSAIPDFFARTSVSNAPSIALPSVSSATTQPQLPSTESSTKSAPFSFAKPDTSSFPSPATPAPVATKPQAPIFGASMGSSSMLTFGSTPAVAKAEASAPPVSTATVTSESSKPIFSFSGTSSLPPTATPSGQSTSSLPKFSFGQTPTSMFAASSNLAPGSASQPKLTFKLGQTPPGATDSASATTVPVAASDESNKPPMPVSAFGAAAGLNEPTKPSPFGTTSAFGSSISSSPSTSVMKLFGKSGVADGDASTSMQPTTSNTFSPQPTGTPVSGGTPVFSFGGAKSGSNSEQSKSTSSFGGAVGGANPVSTFSGSFSEAKPTFSFSPSTEGSKSTSIFGGNKDSLKAPSVFGGSAEGSKPTFAFGGSIQTAKPASVLQGVAEGPKSTFTFGGASEKNPSVADAPKPAPNTGSTTFGPSSSTFSFGKDEVTTNISNSASTQTKPATSFAFGAPSPFATKGDPSQTIFGKPTDAKPSSFGFAGTTGSSSSSSFTFGKSAAQNQNQEQ